MSVLAAVVMIAAALITAALIVLLLRNRSDAPRPQEGVRILAEHVVDKVSTHDGDGTFRYVSPVFAGLLGDYPGTLIGRHPRDFAHPDDALALSSLWRRALQWKGTPASVVWRCRRYDGEYAWLETMARATTSELSTLGEIVCASRDVTERKQIEDALRESENRFRTTLETVPLVAVGLDRAGRITFANEALVSMTGWSRAELIGENWFDRCVVPGHPVRAIFYENIESGDIPAKMEAEIATKDGRRRMIEWDTTVLRSPSGEVVGTASLGADVTERRQEQAALKLLQSITLAISAASDLNGALALTLESLSDATGWGYGEAWLPTNDGARVERITHYSAVGVKAALLIDRGNSETFARGEGLLGRAWESKTVVWAPDVNELASERRSQSAIECGFRAAVALPVLADQDVVAVLVFFMDRPRATDARHTQMVFVVLNQIGAVIARRRAQIQYEAEILHARDAAQAASRAKSDFLSRMSHELRTPLNSVIGFANVMKKNRGGRLTEEELNFLQRITANGQHLLKLVNNVLDIAKVEAGRMSVTMGLVAVDEVIREVASQLEGQPRESGVQLKVEVPEDMIPIESDPILVKQILINLASNAIRFTHKGSVVLGAQSDAETGQPLRIFVRDTGIGIPAEHLEAIFDPFEQAGPATHRAYGGTGLGLSICQAICDALGYRISVESAVEKGSTFTVHLASEVSDDDRSVPNPDTASVPHRVPEPREAQRR